MIVVLGPDTTVPGPSSANDGAPALSRGFFIQPGVDKEVSPPSYLAEELTVCVSYVRKPLG
jgi:hypothetical protein